MPRLPGDVTRAVKPRRRDKPLTAGVSFEAAKFIGEKRYESLRVFEVECGSFVSCASVGGPAHPAA